MLRKLSILFLVALLVPLACQAGDCPDCKKKSEVRYHYVPVPYRAGDCLCHLGIACICPTGKCECGPRCGGCQRRGEVVVPPPPPIIVRPYCTPRRYLFRRCR